MNTVDELGAVGTTGLACERGVASTVWQPPSPSPPCLTRPSSLPHRFQLPTLA